MATFDAMTAGNRESLSVITKKIVDLIDRSTGHDRHAARQRNANATQQIAQSVIDHDRIRPINQFDKGAIEIDEKACSGKQVGRRER